MLTPARLTLARHRRGLTAGELAGKANVSARSIGEYERGRRLPSAATTESLRTALGFPEGFLQAPEPPAPAEVGFRGRTTQSQRRRAFSACQLAVEFHAWLERTFTLPRPAVPALRYPNPETAAESVRARWRLGRKPTPNMVQLLESRGVRVFSLPADCAELETLSFWHKGTPFVALSPTASPERARFDAACELGRLVGQDGGAFAAAFLTRQPKVARRETSRVFRALREHDISPRQVAQELLLTPEDLNGLVFGLAMTAVPGGMQSTPARARLSVVRPVERG